MRRSVELDHRHPVLLGHISDLPQDLRRHNTAGRVRGNPIRLSISLDHHALFAIVQHRSAFPFGFRASQTCEYTDSALGSKLTRLSPADRIPPDGLDLLEDQDGLPKLR